MNRFQTIARLLVFFNFQATLAEEFDHRVRPYIDLVDDLRRHGLERDIQLPSAVVIGDQSSGKSSILEAISGVQLPRGSGELSSRIERWLYVKCPLGPYDAIKNWVLTVRKILHSALAVQSRIERCE